MFANRNNKLLRGNKQRFYNDYIAFITAISGVYNSTIGWFIIAKSARYNRRHLTQVIDWQVVMAGTVGVNKPKKGLYS